MNEIEEEEIIPVKVGITNHTFSQINSTDTTVKINFEVYFCYDEEKILKNFKKEELGEDFEFPFHIQNALEISTQNKWTTYIYSNNIKELNYHDIPSLGNRDNQINPDFRKIKLEKYNIICELKIINFNYLLPFNNILIPIKIITNGCPGSGNIQFKPEDDEEIMWGVKNTRKNFSNYWRENGFIFNPYIKTGDLAKSTKYSRIYFILSYKFGVFMDIIKYYFIPTVMTIILVLFYDMDESDFAGLFSTIILGDIALLFILPATGEFTRNEKSVCFNIVLVIILTIMKINELNLGTLLGTFIFFILNAINLGYDLIKTQKISNKLFSLLESKHPIEVIFDKFDSLDYVSSGSGDKIKTINNYLSEIELNTQQDIIDTVPRQISMI